MITIDNTATQVNVTIFGEFTLADFKEFEQVVNHQVRFEGPVNLLFDLRTMMGVTVDTVLEEIRFARSHPHDFARIAIVTDDQWISWSAWLSQAFLDADVAVFRDVDEAQSWLGADAEADAESNTPAE
ncbi:STAS/SEC14 domain-containing protein [Zoogloea sp.]|uniref:STAS/SEC14 domain-containing protein n=1 Tax=Zoogloea sp. TaxID=49181 RepID=UPI0035B22247